jgi:putative membrane-bound dehydrogenase-like protein
MKSLACGCAILILAMLAAAGEKGPALEPEQALAGFEMEDGLQIELAAAEPLVVDPVALAFDERGRMFVAENRGYPTGPEAGVGPAGIIALLTDTNGDGRYDTRTVFASELSFPNGIQPWRGGIFVTCAPDIFYLKDTTGDGRADVRQVVLTGFFTNSTTQLRVSHPLLHLDGWVYLTSGLTGGNVHSPLHPERPKIAFTRSDSRFHPDTFEFETAGGAGQFGKTFDDAGRRFICSNRNPVQHVVLEPRSLARNPHLPFSETTHDVSPSGSAARVFPLTADTTTASFMPELMSAPHAGTFTAASGLLIFRGTALGSNYYGNAFICESAQNLVQRQIVSEAGSTFESRAATPGKEFLASRDGWFSPVFLANAPDGSLYLCDMYRKTIEHPQYVPESVRHMFDFQSGNDRGRIYRIIAPEDSLARPGRREAKRKLLETLSKQSVPDRCELLNSPDGWPRETAHRLLLEQKSSDAIPRLRALLKRSPSSETFARIHALHLLDAFGALDEEILADALDDPGSLVRETALALAEPRLPESAHLQTLAAALSEDSAPRVRFRAALALGGIKSPVSLKALATIAARDGADKWTRAAVLSSVGQNSAEWLPHVLSAQAGTPGARAAVMADLGKILGASQSLDQCRSITEQILTSASEDVSAWEWQAAGLAGLAGALRDRGMGQGDQPVLSGLLSSGSKEARQRFAVLTRRSMEIAVDASAANPARLAAILFMSHANPASSATVLRRLLSAEQPSEIQIAAVKAMSPGAPGEFAETLLEHQRWRAYTPAVRETVIGTVLGQARFLPALLEAIETQTVQPWTVPPARRTVLLKHRDEKIRRRAEAVFQQGERGDRMKVFESYKSVLDLASNAANGKRVFQEHCSSCHLHKGLGAEVGPDLSGIRNQPAEAILLHTLVPDHEVAPGYTGYEIETKDGRTISGLMASETPSSITIRRALGEDETLLRSTIASVTSTGLSLMPQELEKNMSRQELADLIAFLKE